MSGKYKKVEGLARGLELLRLVSNMESGRARVAELASETGLHRTTVKRLLETLCGEEYLTYDRDNRYYYLSLRARQLSEGFVDEKWIVATAAPALVELLGDVVWPSDLATPQGDQMVIRETTRRFSPFSFHRSMVGTRIPMASTSVGRAYLAYCTDQQRRAIVAYMDAYAESDRDNAATVELLVEQTLAQGYGSSYGEWSAERRFGAIAVPMRLGDQVLGCINIVFLLSSISPSEAGQRFAEPLWRAARKIEATLAAETGQVLTEMGG